ncbi:MAG TPA: CocE/NonD family hydrolase [Solirubrobacteraceae bacterium]|nr:CocE/NonD family hydrolase [Solirubrobacteraceae bacterium]
MTVLATLGALAAAMPSVAAAESYSTKLLNFTLKVGPQPRQSCDVIGQLYTPAGASAAHRVPAILTTNGFGGSYSSQSGLSSWLASNGYVVLEYSGLGFGGSGCQIELDTPEWDGEAASQLITFLGGGSAATDGTRVDDVIHDRVAHNGRHYADDPRVGMIGGSYGGEVQFAAADVDPRIDTIVPLITWNDLSYSLAPNNSSLSGDGVTAATPGDTKFGWLNAFFALGVADGTSNPSGVTTGCPNFDPRACTAAAELDAIGAPTPATTAFARQASVESYIHQIRIPVMLAQGEDDTLFDLHESVATYASLRAERTPVKLVWQSWGHSNSTPATGEWNGANGNGLNSNGTLNVEGRLVLQWFAHYLKGAKAAPALDFSFFRPWVKYAGYNATAAYASAPRYPLGSLQRLYLSGSDALTGTRNAVKSGSASFVTPAAGAPMSVTELSAVSQNVPLFDAPGTYAEFESAPLTRATDVVGIPMVTLRISAPLATPLSPLDPAGGLALFFKLEDISPTGVATLPDRLISPARFADLDGPVTVSLPGIVHQFAAGDRFALIVAGSDAAYRGETFAQPVTISSDPADPGTLTLPVATAGSYTPIQFARAPKRHAHHRRSR